jgi:class 3 adenylate cyclase/PAS domain-containing protein
MTPDMIYSLSETIMQVEVLPYIRNTSAANIRISGTVQDLWSLAIYPVYELLVAPMYETIDVMILDSIDSLSASTVPIVGALIAIAFVLQVISIAAMNETSNEMRKVLMFLLHCPVQAVLQTPRVMAVLSGDFGSRRRDEAGRSASFFRSVVSALPDAVVTIAVETQLVISTNESCERIFGPGVITGSLQELLEARFQGNTEALIKEREKCSNIMVAFVKDQTTTVNLEVNAIHMGETVVYTFRDVTQRVRYNTLIEEESAKSDALLATILPPSLVKRVQAGEKNISFAVQSASISFIDIVEFTPWCGSLPAATVMKTLNALFAKFDGCVGRRVTLTKIKCIGDCYMSAGGIFSEVNQPAVHAKDLVSFGLDAISSLEELNGEVNQHLRIRVGVNTGGPIVAGVLGIGKPTFEILGPAINMAQQMEHHGVPMMVHISRAVYELVYGDTFQIKERGATEINTGTVITYLVSPRTK